MPFAVTGFLLRNKLSPEIVVAEPVDPFGGELNTESDSDNVLAGVLAGSYGAKEC